MALAGALLYEVDAVSAGSMGSADESLGGSRLEFELDFDLRALRASLAPSRTLDESGYRLSSPTGRATGPQCGLRTFYGAG